MTTTVLTATRLGTPVLLASIASVQAFENPVVEQYAAPPSGFSWTELRRNTGIFGKADETVNFTVGEQRWKGVSLIAFASKQETLLADKGGGWVARLGADGKVLAQWDPPLSFSYPLEVSKSWTRTHQVEDAAGKTRRFDVTCRIEGYGEVLLAAGTFRAFEVRCRDTRGLDMTIWHDPSLGIWVKSSLRTVGPEGEQGTREQQLLSVSGGR